MVQLLVNVIDFDMELQPAIEAPRVATYSFVQSNYPHAYFPGQFRVENRVPLSTLSRLSELGHRLYLWPHLAPAAAGLCAVQVDHATGTLKGGADPRRMAYAMGW